MKTGSNTLPSIWRSNLQILVETEPNIGKWSDSEKKIFITYYRLYEFLDDKYNLMGQYIPSRTACQIRSHWQKFNEKMQRDSQKIGNGALASDLNQGKNPFEHEFQFFKKAASYFPLRTGEQLLNLEIIHLNFMIKNSGKPNSRMTRSMMFGRQKMTSEMEQETSECMKRPQTYLIVPPPSNWHLQQREQLQKYRKGNEESNSSSHLESNYEQKRVFEEQKSICYLKVYPFNGK